MQIQICRTHLVALALAALVVRGAVAQPLVDHHQHLFGPTIAARAPNLTPITARDLVKLLDSAGIGRAVILSIAYQYSNPNRPPVEDEYAKVRAENDWTSAQVAEYPDRFRGFCSVNPLKDYALEEIARCRQDRFLHFGLKLHFGNSDVDLDQADQVARLIPVFRAANEAGMAIVVHLHASVTKKRPYGATEARVFLNQVLAAAPDVTVQIAHLAGAGGFDHGTDEALGVFVDAIRDGDPRVARLLFDMSGMLPAEPLKEQAESIARRIRQLGPNRVLYGSDGAAGGNLAPREAWVAFRRLPLSESEFRIIAANVAPYMR